MRLMVIVSLCLSSGCSRMFWRSQADFDTYNLLQRKQFDSRWTIPRTTVEPDPRSRFFDPFDADSPPLPPDDPASGQYMQLVHGMRGYKSWHKFGESLSVENPGWLENFRLSVPVPENDYAFSDGLTTVRALSEEVTDETPAELVPTIEKLTLAQAVELGNINSREYQTQIEDAYLSALQLTLDQFQFEVRYLGFGAQKPTGILTATDVPSTSDTVGLKSRFGVSQLLPTGGQWIVEMANNTLWLFSGGQQSTSASVLSYSLVQPLLLGAGRKIGLENLTLSERESLYDLRTLARYRKLFFADTVTGSNGGFLDLLRQAQAIDNQSAYVAGLYTQTERQRQLVAKTPYRHFAPGAFPPGIEFPPDLTQKIEFQPDRELLYWKAVNPMTPDELRQLLLLSDDAGYKREVKQLFDLLLVGGTSTDVLQLATQLSSAEIQLRALQRNYADAVDRYKLFLGLPTDLSTTVDLTLIKQFQLISPQNQQLELALVEFVNQTSLIDDLDPPLKQVRLAADSLSNLLESVRNYTFDEVPELFEQVMENLPVRLSRLKFENSREQVQKALARDRVLLEMIQENVDGPEGQAHTDPSAGTLFRMSQRLLKKEDASADERRRALTAINDTREKLFTVVQSLRVIEIGLRSELITLPEFDLSLESVVSIAVENRLDLMNSRGRVMDARRAMEVVANRLEAVVNLVAAGDLNTLENSNQPFSFRGSRSSFRFGVQMTAPIDQVAERNAYRASLISYQRLRRDYMRQEDLAKFEVRTHWRQLNVTRTNFEVSRKNLRQAAFQLDTVVTNAEDPNRSQVGRAGMTASTGNNGLNLLNALNSVLQAQNTLIQLWVDHERSRVNIYRDMDTMQIDETGLWLDPVYQDLR